MHVSSNDTINLRNLTYGISFPGLPQPLILPAQIH